jgi:hypothetical protein
MARPGTRYDKLPIAYRGAVLRAITLWQPDLSDTP